MRVLPFALLATAWLVQAVLAQGSIVTLPAVTEGAGQPRSETAGDASGASSPAPCGEQPITIAKMGWPSAAILAEIHALILRDQFGCRVGLVPGDLAATGSSMGVNGQPAVAPEMWIARVPDIWNAGIKAQTVRQAGPSYVEALFEGWFIPDYVAAAHPDLTNLAALKANAGLFSGGGKRAKFISCPPDWACAVVNRNLLRASGLEQQFDIVEPANRFELDNLIAEAASRKEPIVFYYWQPNAVLAQFGFFQLDLGAFDKDAFACAGRIGCASPRPTSYAPDPVVIALSEWVYEEAPEIASYFQRAHMPLSEMNTLLQNLSAPGATVQSVVGDFVAARGEVWRDWVGDAPNPAP